ncbi:unnamed protein product, partial [Rotaria magnacalcarata]
LSKDSPASSQHSDRIKCSEIQSFLKLQPKKYIIIENAGKHMSHCWETFGFLALVHKDADPERIDGFVSCKKCLTTYSFVSNSTRLLNQHRCDVSIERRKRLESHDGSYTQRNLNGYFSKAAQLKESEITNVKHLEAEWICQSIRPFSIVEDAGLRKLMQECISI